MSHFIYKILTADQWQAFQSASSFDGAPIDLADGYIHFSTAQQAAETAAKHFADQDGLMLAAVDGDALGDGLKYEVSRGGALFPHYYGTLTMAAVLWCRPMPLDANGVHQLPLAGDE